MKSMSLEIHTVHSRQQEKQFLNLPWSLYKHDPHWVPPLRGNQRQLCGFAKHPFYRNAESQAFLAQREGRVVGRVLAVSNRAHNNYHDDKLGFFGFFESVDDAEVSQGLLSAAEDYLKGRGLESIRGPVNPSMNYECGLLVDSFQSPPVFMMTYNPPYYGRLIEQAGFEKSHDLYAYLGSAEMLELNEKRWEFIRKKLGEKIRFAMRAMERPRFDEEMRGFLDVYNQALVGSWGFVPITPAEITHMASGLKQLIAPELTAVVEVDGKRAGVAFGILDYNPRIKQIDGRLFPFGFLRLLRNRKAIKRMRMISANVLPEFQGNKGMGLALFCSLIPAIRDWGIQQCEFSWVLESNQFSRATLERCGTQLYKTYRIYDKRIV